MMMVTPRIIINGEEEIDPDRGHAERHRPAADAVTD